MDWLSHLADMMVVHGSIDFRCVYGAPWRIDRHRARESEIPFHVVLSGSAWLENADGGRPLLLNAGDILLVNDSEAHVLHDGSGTPPLPAKNHATSGVTISVNGAADTQLDMLCGRFIVSARRNRLLREYLPRRWVARTGDVRESPASAQLADLVAMIREESSLAGLGSQAMLNAFCAALFILALRYATDSSAHAAGLLSVAAHARLAPALAAMFQEPQQPWTASDLARLCGMSPATIARHFKERLGRSASDLLLEIRMTMATNALMDSSASVGAIGEAVGYRSEAAFQRIFKQHIGMTPAQWRRESLRKSSEGSR
jgi:AraC family transcriptional regulator, activator of mtrCDE